MDETADNRVLIRHADVRDSHVIHKFVKELADFEQSGHQVTATVESIAASIFAADTHTFAVIAEVGGNAVGFAVYFYNYSTWQAKSGLYLEDLYVTPTYRGSGVGKALLRHLAGIALEKSCGRFEWVVLDWNMPAIDFYASIGAKPQSEWVKYRMEGRALTDFAEWSHR
jgi:GNAT superfamily N-acetyltransferase